jgi:MazG family protein
MKIPPQSSDALADLIAVARDLRDKNGGCPWDLEQTHTSLAKHLIEESSELVEVIEKGITKETDAEFKEELGDVLFQVIIHTQLASEEGRFDFSDVARFVADKLISRHPHVYVQPTAILGSTDPGSYVSAENSEQVLKNWEAIKVRERQKKQARTSYLDGVPKALAALQRADRLGEKAARIGFDWPKGQAGTEMLRNKVTEELAELDEAVGQSVERATEELGDLFFALAQYGRRLGIDPEGALRKACNKFELRFRMMEIEAAPKLTVGQELSAEEWDVLWRRAKSNLTPPMRQG